jgi:hypothetical protein
LESVNALKRYKDKGQLFTLAQAIFASRSGRPIPGGATEQSLAELFSEDRKLINLISPTTTKFVKQVYHQILRPHIAKDDNLLGCLLKDLLKVMEDSKLQPIVFDMFDCFFNKTVILGATVQESETYSRILYELLCQPNTPFLHRQISLILSSLIITRSGNLSIYRKCIKLLLKKREVRPRDTNIFLTINEFITDLQYDNMEPMDFMDTKKHAMAVYGAFPRFFILLSLSKTIDLELANPTAHSEFLGEFIQYLLDTINKWKYVKGLRPFEDKHKHQLCLLQALLVLSKFIRKSQSAQAAKIRNLL